MGLLRLIKAIRGPLLQKREAGLRLFYKRGIQVGLLVLEDYVTTRLNWLAIRNMLKVASSRVSYHMLLD